METKSNWNITPATVVPAFSTRKKPVVHKDLWEKERIKEKKEKLSAMSEAELFDAVLDEEAEELLLAGETKNFIKGSDEAPETNVFSAPESLSIVENLGITDYDDGDSAKDTQVVWKDKTYKDVKDAILASGGMVTHVARRLGMSTTMVKNLFLKYKSLGSMFSEYKEAILDEVEMHLIKKIRSGDKGDTLAMIFYLKCIGKERGYIDRVVNNDAGKKSPVKLTIIGAESYEGKKKRLEKIDSAVERTLQ